MFERWHLLALIMWCVRTNRMRHAGSALVPRCSLRYHIAASWQLTPARFTACVPEPLTHQSLSWSINHSLSNKFSPRAKPAVVLGLVWRTSYCCRPCELLLFQICAFARSPDDPFAHTPPCVAPCLSACLPAGPACPTCWCWRSAYSCCATLQPCCTSRLQHHSCRR